MKRFKDSSYRFKLMMVFFLVALIVITVVTIALTAKSSQTLQENLHAHLDLLTEQALLNFENETSSVAAQFMNQLRGQNIPDFLFSLSPEETAVSLQRTREITDALSRAITVTSGYDSIYIRATNGLSFTNTFADAAFVENASLLLETYGAKTYGAAVWVRAADREVYLVRDVYHLVPFRFVGKALAHIHSSMLADLGTDKFAAECTMLFYDQDRYIMQAGQTLSREMLDLAEAGTWTEEDYLSSERNGGIWRAVGLLPSQVLQEANGGVLRTGIIIGVAGILIGVFLVYTLTGSMTKKIRTLLNAMDAAAAGQMDTRAPITSQDEIGQLSEHFNTMLSSNQDLMEKVLQEEKRKNQAEYDALEYRYRSLQSQINPHFIYNAMEVVNAMAKLDGKEEICEVVTHISSFFRQNTHNMGKKFITVSREFDSLQEYACIFRHIYGNVLETPFICDTEAEQALIPTMILQPLIENALTHGVRAQQAKVSIRAESADGKRLIITVADNGKGMSEETLRHILESTAAEETGKKPVSGVGVRNVRGRLLLIYGNRASFDIQSAPERGTVVTIGVPLVYDEKELEQQIKD